MTKAIAAGIVVLGLVAIPAEAPSCGPVFPEVVFTFEKTPHDYSGYIDGKLGVVQPAFYRRYLVIAYRYLTANPITKEEIASLEPTGPSADVWKSNDDWRRARDSVMKAATPFISPYRSHEKYSSYDNCRADAFANAARTLEARVKTFGAAHAGVKAWIEAQDAVFANCSQGRKVPAEPGPDLPPVLRADREYQIAAAHFYSESYEEAHRRFRKIAADRESPWSAIAPYLAARCLVRESSLSDARKYDEALKQLDALLADPRYREHREAAQSLKAFVLLRLRPQEVADRVSRDLRNPANASRFRQNLIDLNYAWERGGAIPKDDMGEWISWMGSQNHEEAMAKWKPAKGQQWLVAALMSATPKDAGLGELMAAADTVPEQSPAYSSVLFHKLRLMEESGKRPEVRAELDRKLPAIRDRLPQSAVNLFLAQRMRLAQSLDEFLRFAPRRAVGVYFFSESDATEPGKTGETAVPDALLDDDSLRVFNFGLPLGLLRDAALSKALPAAPATRVLALAFTRAVVLGRHDVALQLGTELAARRTMLRVSIEQYRAAKTDEEKAFAAALAVLRAPGLRNELSTSLASRDEVQLQAIDDYRQNWWCKADPKAQPALPAFSSEAGRKEFEGEWAKLQALPAAPAWLGRQAVEWAKAHPEDPRSPEALHLTVRATRYGCADDGVSPVSKAAFTALHARWPKSEWAAKTPYWY